MDAAIEKLANLLDKDPYQISQLLSDRSTSRYLKLAENIDSDTVDAIAKLNLPGVGVTPTSARYYPMGSLGAHLLGGTGKDGRGLEGLELKFDSELAGKNGSERVLKDARRRPIDVAADDYLPAQHGKHLVLTIDSNIQMITEQELNDTCNHFTADRGEAVVMDPKTGDVLALANWPTFNPQNLDDSTPALRRNRALTDPYEPGSTIKPFIVGPALEHGDAHVTEMFHLGGAHYTTPYGRHITDVHGYDDLCLWDVLVQSSNIGMSQLGEKLGNAKLHAFLGEWNFGHPTGIELPGENGGRLNPLRKWNTYSTESASQGYEVMVTPHAALPGVLRLRQRGPAGGTAPDPRRARHRRQRHPPHHAQTLGRLASGRQPRNRRRDETHPLRRPDPRHSQGDQNPIRRVEHFRKTGTAHISEGKAGYSSTRFNSSFLAGAPAENPRLIIAFIIHDPDRTKAHYGGWVAAPGASRVLQRSLAYLGVPASPDLPLPPPAVANLLVDYKPSDYDRAPKEVADAEQ